jgi:hypothetical protein
MSNSMSKSKSKSRSRHAIDGVYMKMLIDYKVPLEFRYVNRLLTENILEYLRKRFEGKCCEQGYIRPDTIAIVNYSSGIVKNNLIIFDVVFECEVCYLLEDQEINCIAKNITKAGIRAEFDMDKTPAVIFVARDHHYVDKNFNDVKEGNIMTVKIIGQRFELNDPHISAIAELVKVSKQSKKLVIEEKEELKVEEQEKSVQAEEEQEEATQEELKTERLKKDVKEETKEESKDVVDNDLDNEVEKLKNEIEKTSDNPQEDNTQEDNTPEDNSPEDNVLDNEVNDELEKLKVQVEKLKVQVENQEDKEPQDKEPKNVEETITKEADDEDEDEMALKALEMLEKSIEEEKNAEFVKDQDNQSKENEVKEKPITITPDTKQPVKRPRGRPKKNP